MVKVRHDHSGDRAVRIREPVPDVEIADHFPISDALKDRIGCRRSHSRVVVGPFAGWKDREEKNLALGNLLAEFLHEGHDSVGDLLRRVAVDGIIVADQHDNGLGMDAVEISVFDSPEHMLSAVGVHSEIGGLALPVI